jgi:hypothetical protein
LGGEEQALPQAPQLLTSLPMLAQTGLALPQQTSPAGQSEPRLPQVQWPPTHVSPAGHWRPQLPQLEGSLPVSRQTLPHWVSPA